MLKGVAAKFGGIRKRRRGDNDSSIDDEGTQGADESLGNELAEFSDGGGSVDEEEDEEDNSIEVITLITNSILLYRVANSETSKRIHKQQRRILSILSVVPRIL